MENNFTIIDLTPENIADYGVCGYKDVAKHKELQNKISWFSRYYKQGLKIKVLLAADGSYQGMLEYIPGELAHRPVNAKGYLFIHCVFVGFKKIHKDQGYASALLEQCFQDAQQQNKLGVAVVTRKGSFMVDNKIFLKKGFEIVDKAKPDFELLVYKFDPHVENPGFKSDVINDATAFTDGLTIMRSPQCPYTEKNVHAIIESAEKNFKLKTRLIDLNTAEEAQINPSAFGSFSILYDGKVISHHPISQTRFENIMNKLLS